MPSPTIADVLAMPTGAIVRGLRARVASISRDFTKSQKVFLRLDLNDKTGTLSSNVFDNVEQVDAFVKNGGIVEIDAVRDEFNGKPQLKFKAIRPVADGEYNLDDFIPAYVVPADDLEFLAGTIFSLEDPWASILEHAFGLGVHASPDRTHLWTDFITAPAAKRHHGNKLGGLVLHTIGVLRVIDSVLASRSYPGIADLVNVDRLRFLAIFHDYCKMWDYVWKTGIAWNDETKVDHRTMGIVAFERFVADLNLDLPYAERQLVIYSLAAHHGAMGELQPKSLEDWLLHLADFIDAKVVEATDAAAAQTPAV